jgi:hypothetical protein
MSVAVLTTRPAGRAAELVDDHVDCRLDDAARRLSNAEDDG